MASLDFPALFDTLKTGVVDLAKTTLGDYAKQATQVGQAALEEMKSDIEEWSKSLATGDMNIDDLKFLIAGRKELTEMQALEQIGIAQIELDKFKNGLINLITSTISGLL